MPVILWREVIAETVLVGVVIRSRGMMVGARDLTWSYASFLEAARARQSVRAKLGVIGERRT